MSKNFLSDSIEFPDMPAAPPKLRPRFGIRVRAARGRRTFRSCRGQCLPPISHGLIYGRTRNERMSRDTTTKVAEEAWVRSGRTGDNDSRADRATGQHLP